MIEIIQHFVYYTSNKFGLDGRILFIGNDLDAVECFPKTEYVQIDCAGEGTPYADGSFDKVYCIESLQEELNFFAAIKEIKRVLKVGGLLVITTAGLKKIAVDSRDLWRFTGRSLEIALDGFTSVYSEDYACSQNVFAYGIKKQPTISPENRPQHEKELEDVTE